MAGNIIPAIATTNAIVAGILVLQCLKALQNQWQQCKMVWVARTADRAIATTEINTPNPSCAVCRTPYIPIKVNAAKLTIQTFVQEVVKDKVGLPGDVSLVEGSRVLLDPDFDDNEEKTFEHLGLVDGTLLTVNDEEGDLEPVVFLISSLSDGEKQYSLPDTLPKIPSKPPAPIQPVEEPAEPASIVGKKRSADDAELDEGKKSEPKKPKVDSKGVILLDDSDDDIEVMQDARQNANANVIELD